MSRTITVGIDVGSHECKVIIAEVIKNKGKSSPLILGMGVSDSRGALRHGYITSVAETARAIRLAANQAEEKAGIKIKKAFLAVGGVDLVGTICEGSTIISRADLEITDLDMKNAVEATENGIPASLSQNRKTIHSIELAYKIDGKPVYGHPHGMHGSKLEARVLFVSCYAQHLRDLIAAVEEAEIEIEDVMAAPLAASLVTLSNAQKIAGCVLVNIGAETTSVAVFEDTYPLSMEVFPVGSNDLTNDIALGLKVSLEEAELIKVGSITSTQFSKKKLDEITEMREKNIFEAVSSHLKRIGKNELLPAGIILIGGGSRIVGIEDVAKAYLKLPSKIGEINLFGKSEQDIKDSTWAVAYGLCILGFTQGSEGSIRSEFFPWLKTLRNKIARWIQQFLP